MELMVSLTMLHSFAFGGRGIFVVCGRGSCSRNKVKKKNSHYPCNCPSHCCNNPNSDPSHLFLKNPVSTRPKKWISFFMLLTVVIVGAFVIGSGLPIFDSNCGFPGEGPKKMTPAIEQWYRQNFTDDDIRAISNKIVYSGHTYKHACTISGYNFVWSDGKGKYMGGGTAPYYRLQHDVAKVRKMQKAKITANR